MLRRISGCHRIHRARAPSLRRLFTGEPQITLWHSPDARSMRCLWTLEEIGLKDYQLITMPFPPRIFCKDFLKINILGTIPLFKDGERTMTESSAICQYLAVKYGSSQLQIQADEPEYADYINWIHHADATLTFPQTIVLRYTLMEPGKCDAAAADYAKWYLARLRLLDSKLADGREFLVGGKFTIADICIGYALYVAKAFSLKIGSGELIADHYNPPTAAYLQRALQRPAFLRCLQLQNESLALFLKKQ